jgi:CPA1 family monovalent cation:H+ antiporter
LQSRAVWDLLVFVLNAMIFVLLGAQFKALWMAAPADQLRTMIWHGLIISVLAMVVRLAWVPVATWVPRWLDEEIRRTEPIPNPKSVFLVSWTSMRGIVSLATAFALPITLGNGSGFPFRTELIFITMIVILFTLIVQGCTLAPIIRRMQFAPEAKQLEEERFARLEALRRSAEALEDASREGWANPADVAWLRAELKDRIAHHQEPDAGNSRRRLRNRMQHAERRLLVRLRNEGAISDDVLRDLEQELDLDALRSAGHAGHSSSGTEPL